MATAAFFNHLLLAVSVVSGSSRAHPPSAKFGGVRPLADESSLAPKSEENKIDGRAGIVTKQRGVEMPEEIKFRELSDNDVQAVYEVALEAWQFTYQDIYASDFIKNFVNENYAPAVSLRLLPRIQAGQQFFQVAVNQSSVVGFCHIAKTKEGMELLRIYLRPAYIGQGIGRELLHQGEEFIKAQGYNSYFCFVHKNNELGKNFYLRNGFSHLIENDEDDDCIWKKSWGNKSQGKQPNQRSDQGKGKNYVKIVNGESIRQSRSKGS